VEFPIYAGLTFIMINALGIDGAALALCLRMAWTIPIFTLLSMRVARVSINSPSENGTIRSVLIAAGAIIASIAFLIYNGESIGAIGLLTCLLLLGYIIIVWRIAFDSIDKNFIKGSIIRFYNYSLAKGDNVHVQR